VTQGNGLQTRTHLLALVLATTVVGLPLLAGRVLSGQDIVNYLIIAQQTASNMREGALLPAWAGGFNAGYGSPLLVFFPPLTGATNAVPVLLGLPVITGVCLTALMAHFLSGAAAYGWLRSIGARNAALPAAVVYAVAPYRLINLYLRSALAEHWAFIWPPVVLWIATDRRLRSTSRVSLLALATAAFLLTNIPLAVLFGIGLAAWFLVSPKLRGLRRQVGAGVGLGFGLATFMLVPQALAGRFLNLDICFGPAASRLRPSANTLFSAGFEVWNLNTLFSLVLLATFTLVVTGYLLLPLEKKKGFTEGGLLAASVVCLVVTLGPAGPVWDALPILSKLQFPWRITAVLTLLAAAMVSQLEFRRAWLVAALTAAVSIPFASWDRTVPRSVFSAPEPPPAAPGSVFPDPRVAWEAGSGGWYWRHENLVELCLVPQSMPGFFFDEFRGVATSRLDPIRHRPVAVLEDPSAVLRVIKWGQIERQLEVGSELGGTLLWRVVWFPGMVITVDGQRVETYEHATTGLIAHHLAPGSHIVSLRWRAFPALRVARWISFAAAAVLVVLVGHGAVAARRRPSPAENDDS
jgi:hypothetical protein